MNPYRIITAFLFIAAMWSLQPEAAQAETANLHQGITAGLQDATAKPFIVYYSRTGSAQKVATALQNQLGCGREEIATNSNIGTGTIFMDQVFNRTSTQEPSSRVFPGMTRLFW